MRLKDILERDANNLDLFRVIAASMVIFGHAYALVPQAGRSDLIRQWLVFDYAGSLAVRIFFLLSGLVVTNSLLTKRRVLPFVIARFFRLWPALAVTVILCALVLGPLLTSLPLDAYFFDPDTGKYIYRNLLMQIQYRLPGVFQDNALSAVNGSLWTIPYEVKAYAMVLLGYLLGLFRRAWLPLVLLPGVFALPFLFPDGNKEVDLVLSCFAMGAVLAAYKDRLIITPRLIALCWVSFFLVRQTPLNVYGFYIALFLTLIYASSQPWMLALKLRADLSYGIYLWGFPIQQVMAQHFGYLGIGFNQVASLAVCLLLALASWHLVEKRAIALGATLSRRLTSRAKVPVENAVN